MALPLPRSLPFEATTQLLGRSPYAPIATSAFDLATRLAQMRRRRQLMSGLSPEEQTFIGLGAEPRDILGLRAKRAEAESDRGAEERKAKREETSEEKAFQRRKELTSFEEGLRAKRINLREVALSIAAKDIMFQNSSPEEQIATVDRYEEILRQGLGKKEIEFPKTQQNIPEVPIKPEPIRSKETKLPLFPVLMGLAERLIKGQRSQMPTKLIKKQVTSEDVRKKFKF